MTRCCGPEGCGLAITVGDKESGDPRELGRRYCIASACMAWRDSGEIERRGLKRLAASERPDGFVDRDTADSDGWRWASVVEANYTEWHQWRRTGRGFCGLAGAPTC